MYRKLLCQNRHLPSRKLMTICLFWLRCNKIRYYLYIVLSTCYFSKIISKPLRQFTCIGGKLIPRSACEILKTSPSKLLHIGVVLESITELYLYSVYPSSLNMSRPTAFVIAVPSVRTIFLTSESERFS